MNYATTSSFLRVDPDAKTITLELQIDTEMASVMKYFELFMPRMQMCRRAANLLALNLAAFEFMGDRYAVVDCPGSTEFAAAEDLPLGPASVNGVIGEIYADPNTRNDVIRLNHSKAADLVSVQQTVAQARVTLAREEETLVQARAQEQVLRTELERLQKLKLLQATIGGLVYMLMLSTAMSAELYGIDPFDQPGVEHEKQAMFAQLGRAGFEDLAKRIKDYRALPRRTC